MKIEVNEAQLVALDVVRVVLARVYTDNRGLPESLRREVLRIVYARFRSKENLCEPRIVLDLGVEMMFIRGRKGCRHGCSMRVHAEVPLHRELLTASGPEDEDSHWGVYIPSDTVYVEIRDPEPPCSGYMSERFRYRERHFGADVRIIEK